VWGNRHPKDVRRKKREVRGHQPDRKRPAIERKDSNKT
jgi:hypothetical protein